jgi:FAD/FMN-containing dehydrogenase
MSTEELNDIHSRLNATTPAEIHKPTTVEQIQALVKKAAADGQAVGICGAKHSMGGQQFISGGIQLDLSEFKKVIGLDSERGIVTAQAGIFWPALIDWLLANQPEGIGGWGIRQKQTGGDEMSIGGGMGTNIHGRGLDMKPLVDDIESFELIQADGELVKVDREHDLFGLVIGGYGLFGVVTQVSLRLEKRQKLVRKVEVAQLKDVPKLVEQRIADGYRFGDYQFKTDEKADDFLEKGVFSFYKPVANDTPMPEGQKTLSELDWGKLYYLAHEDKAGAYQKYVDFYMSSDGQHYWSDTHQLGWYVTGHDDKVDAARDSRAEGSLMICEFYVKRNDLPEFLRNMGKSVIANNADLIYGTVRYIEKDDKSFLAWARDDWATTVVNLRVLHDSDGIAKAKKEFQDIIDCALDLGGSYFLTYHRWARKEQVLKAYPRFVDFLKLKLKYDPSETFQSEWYRHYTKMFAQELGLES